MIAFARLAALAALALLLAPSGLSRAASIRVSVTTGADEVSVGRRDRALRVTSSAGSSTRSEPGLLHFAARAESSPAAPAAPDRFLVRARTEKDRRKADLVAKSLKDALEAPMKVERAGGVYAILAGPFETEQRADSIRGQLRAAGMTEASVVRLPGEEPEAPAGPRVVGVNGRLEPLALAGDRVLVSASDGEPIELDGQLYRGSLEILADAAGRVAVVNIVEVEDYLRGVVPEEMGPELYPMPAALEAQAVAARTYVQRAKNHAGEGFDACSTAHCQVYGGASSEHPMSDAAVSATAGRVLTHEGRLAMTYFSSTCGGRTEDVTDVFEGPGEPYLRGVSCYPEQLAFRRVQGRRLVADWTLASGAPADQLLAELVAAGVVTDGEAQAGGFGRRLTAEEARQWLQRAASSAGASLQGGAADSLVADTMLALLRGFVAALGWSDQQRLIAGPDVVAARRFREMQGLPDDELMTALIALKNGLLPSGLQPGWAAARPTRGQALEILAGWLEARGRLEPAPMRFVGAREGSLTVLANKQVVALPITSQPLTLGGRRGSVMRWREAIDLKLGDKIWVTKDAAGAAAIIAVEEDPDGAAFDRTSSYSWWMRRIPAEQLTRDAASKAGVTGLKDLRVTRVSPGGRVVGLDLVGSETTRSLQGFAVRGFLGLPDLRASLLVERDAQGRFLGVVATGRGWGHGVGLCQTGAYGMALAGADAATILAHYFPGTTLSGGE